MKASHKEGRGLQEDMGLVVHLSLLLPVQLGEREGGWTNCTHQPRYSGAARDKEVTRKPPLFHSFAAGSPQVCCGFAAGLLQVCCRASDGLCIAISGWNSDSLQT